MTVASADPKRAFIAACTALGFARGGMVICDPMILAVDRAVREMDAARRVVDAARDPALAAVVQGALRVIDARIAGDEHAFAQEHGDLQIALRAFWGDIVKRHGMPA